MIQSASISSAAAALHERGGTNEITASNRVNLVDPYQTPMSADVMDDLGGSKIIVTVFEKTRHGMSQERASSAMCAFSTSGQKMSSRVFVIFMSKNLSTNLYRHLRRLTVSYKGEISLHFDLPGLYSCCIWSLLLWALIKIPASGLSRYS